MLAQTANPCHKWLKTVFPKENSNEHSAIDFHYKASIEWAPLVQPLKYSHTHFLPIANEMCINQTMVVIRGWRMTIFGTPSIFHKSLYATQVPTAHTHFEL